MCGPVPHPLAPENKPLPSRRERVWGGAAGAEDSAYSQAHFGYSLGSVQDPLAWVRARAPVAATPTFGGGLRPTLAPALDWGRRPPACAGLAQPHSAVQGQLMSGTRDGGGGGGEGGRAKILDTRELGTSGGS